MDTASTIPTTDGDGDGAILTDITDTTDIMDTDRTGALASVGDSRITPMVITDRDTMDTLTIPIPIPILILTTIQTPTRPPIAEDAIQTTPDPLYVEEVMMLREEEHTAEMKTPEESIKTT